MFDYLLTSDGASFTKWTGEPAAECEDRRLAEPTGGDPGLCLHMEMAFLIMHGL